MTLRILTGDALATLRTLPAGSVNCCVTSPPYWGLRDYGAEGQIGLERTPELYVARLVEVFAEVRRVLRDDGTLWLNLGDCYATGAGKVGDCPGGGEQGARWAGEVTRHRDAKRRDATPGDMHGGHRGSRGGSSKQPHTGANVGPMTQPNRMPIPGLKPKDLVGIPWRVAFALQADGWYLRSDIIWHKPNPMPSSVTDRPTGAHEYLFLLSKGERYYFDAAAIAEPAVGDHRRNKTDPELSRVPGAAPHRGLRRQGKNEAQPDRRRAGFNARWDDAEDAGEVATTRNRRSVWTIATHPYAEAHFATMPPALVEPCILAGSPVGGGILDPFAGAGTVGLVALRLQRTFVGIEIKPEYVAMAERRIRGDAPLFHGAA